MSAKRCPQVLRRSISSQSLDEAIDENEFKTAKPFSSIPGPRRSNYLWTMWKKNGGLRLNKAINNYHKKYGPIYRMEFPGSYQQIFINDPDDAQKLFEADGKYPNEPGFDFLNYYRNHVRPDLFPKSGGLLGSQGERWHTMRSMVQPSMMRPNSALQYASGVAATSDRLLDNMDSKRDENNEVDDIVPYLERWSLEAVSSIFIDANLDCLSEDLPPDSDGAQLIRMVQASVNLSGFFLYNGFDYWKWIPSSFLKPLDEASETINIIAKKYVGEAVERYNANPDKDVDDMNVLERLINDCGPKNLDIPVLMALDALAAGIDTTGLTASWLLYNLARNPRAQQKLHDEITEFFGSGDIIGKDLKSMKYLSACLKESMRLKPSLAGVNRRTNMPIVLKGYQIPTGTVVTYFSMINGVDGKIFPHPKEFMPERWLREHPSYMASHPLAIVPFGHGPRMCIGRRFAEMEVMVVVIRTIQRYWLDHQHKEIVSDTFMVNRPSKPIRLQFDKRI